ncbi:MAG: bifunctional enoyl-CoA hydratase/phosphate acetyltransferase [Rhodocyclaceae bacterium]|nr:bifunctional enoyl-CoA hydratase/phosphate acetyltransferase [Rhodocyclaceae bacterium]
MTETQFIENRTFDEIKVGDTATLSRTLRAEDIQLFAVMSGDVNPAHVDPDYAKSSMFREVIAHGMWGGALISTVLGTQFPGPGTIYVDQSLHFSRPVGIGDTVTIRVTAARKFEHNRHIIMDCLCTNQDGLEVIRGQAEVLAPREKVKRPRIMLPEVQLHDRNARYKQLMALTEGLPKLACAVAHPCDEASLKGALGARDAGLIRPLLVGPDAKIRATARTFGLDLNDTQIVDVPHSHAAAAISVELVRRGEAQALMKGSLHTDELMAEVVSRATGLRTARRISHVFLMDVPAYPHPLFITDAAVNIEPSLEEKVDIVQNAIDLCHALGMDRPKVAILSAVETVTPKLRSTLDAAALCKMADRGQITGGELDGPLAFDNAVSLMAARTKGIKSLVAGNAEILVVPDLESGNMLAKQVEYFADGQAAGIVLGAKVPIVLTSRADSMHSRIASCAVAVLVANHQARNKAPA